MTSPKLFRLLVVGGALLGQAGCGAPKDPDPMMMMQATDDGGDGGQGSKDMGPKPDLIGINPGGDGAAFW